MRSASPRPGRYVAGLQKRDPDEEARHSLPWSKVLEWAAVIVPPITLVTALAIWYGYELTLARARYFGLDPSVLGFTSRDYVMRAAPAVLAPLLYLLVTLLLLLAAHAGVRWALHFPPLQGTVRVGAVVVTLLGVVMVVEGLRAIADGSVLHDRPVTRPLVLALGAVLACYGPWVYRQTMRSRRSGSDQRGLGASLPDLEALLPSAATEL
jgi:hypothetical protein